MYVPDLQLKPRKLGICGAIIAMCFLVIIPASAQQDPRDSPSVKESFIIDLQKAVRENNASWIASHIKYPARYFQNKKSALIRTPEYFKANYQKIIGPKLRTAVLKQSLNDFLENWQGVMIGDGGTNIWAREFGNSPKARYLIVTINDNL